jgi:hypothetical protein
MANVFFSYSHLDEPLRDQLEKQLTLLKRTGIIDTWHDRRIGAGEDIGRETDRHVDTDDIILLLVSADFLASDYCYDREMTRAVQRHVAGDAIVIPIILRACDWKGAPFGHLNATPPDGRPVTQYPDRDQGMFEVAKAVRAAAEKINLRRGGGAARAAPPPSTPPSGPGRTGPRSSNLRLAKEFTDREKEQFKLETFEFLAKFFENSLQELSQRNSGIDGSFRRIDSNRFTAKVYKNGKSVALCTVFMGGHFMSDGIAYSSSETSEGNAYNEMLSVKADDQSLYLDALGLAVGNQREKSKLSQEGAAELYWEMLIGRLQSR